MAQRQRQVADVILQDPAVQSLTSFVGVDGTNPSLNSARLQINLKPLDKRDDRVQKVIARLQTAVDKVPGGDSVSTPSAEINPNPFALLNHFTTPISIVDLYRLRP